MKVEIIMILTPSFKLANTVPIFADDALEHFVLGGFWELEVIFCNFGLAEKVEVNSLG